jgi:carbon-monoxide dehydrogenase large subunit
MLRGTASYTDDVKVAGSLHAAFVRAEVAHATVGEIDTSAASAAPGVVGVFTAGDLDIDPISVSDPVPESTARPVLAADRVRFMGEAVAVVVAESRAQAVDAAELVAVDYEPLEVVVDAERAADDGAPLLYPELGTNVVVTGDPGEPALDGAEVVVRARLVNQRLAAVPLEPATALAAPDAETGGITLWVPVQAPHSARRTVARCLKVDKRQVRVIAPAVGGGFGARIPIYPEAIVLAGLALRLGRPVRYVESRWESMVAMQHGRAQLQDVELGATRDGRVTGLKARIVADCGAYPGDAAEMPELTGLMLSGVYAIPKVDYQHRCVVTNTTPIGAYRGAGRPEATALLERSLDLLAGELGLDPAEVRRRNFIAPEDFPHETVTGANYDSGRYEMALERVLEAAGYEELRAEQAARRERDDPTQIGIGMSTYVEWTGFGSELGTCTVDGDGKVTVTSGTSPHGQGHATTWTQLVSSELGVDPADVTIVQSDTKLVARGQGTMGSRSLQVGGTAVVNASREVLEKGKRIAAHLLEASPEDIEVFPGQGLGVAGTPATAIPWSQLAATAEDPAKLPAGLEPGLAASHDFETPDATYPFGAHLAVVEVDLETGSTRYLRHVSVDDAGRIANPLLVAGQVHGGIAQGAAQALFEEIAYDEDGNNVNGSLASYCMPGAADVPSYETQRTETPTPRNPLGAKGIGEAGTIGATPAVHNAVIDAVAHLGVRHIDMPTTPQRVWRAIEEARRAP